MELLEAASEGDALRVKQLVSAGVSIDVTDNMDQTPLLRAARNGHLDVVRFLVQRGAAVDARDSDRKTPLMKATKNGYLDMVQFLVKYGADVNASDGRYRTPLICAAKKGHLDMARFLVEGGADVNASDNDGSTPLICACEKGYLDMARFLVECGATADTIRNQGVTSLICACEKGYLDMAQFLMEYGVDVNASDVRGRTPLSCAAKNGHLDMARFLVEGGATVNASDDDDLALICAAGNGHFNMVRFLMKRGAFVNSSDCFGTTPLMQAASGGLLDMVRFLVESGANVNASDNNGRTPLSCACEKGYLDMVRFLVEHGATVDVRVAPLKCAVENCHLNVARYLMEHGAVADAIRYHPVTSLICAAENGHLDMVRFLVELGAPVDVRGGEFRVTPLICAAKTGHLDMVRFLVEHGAIVDAHDKRGMTSLICAAENGHLDMVRYLVEHGAIVDAHDKRGMTSLICAARDGHLDMVRFLINHGADVNAHDKRGMTSLICAAKTGHLEMARYLVEYGADVDSRDGRYRMPLIEDTRGGFWGVARFLAEQGADLTASNNDGWAPLIFAAENGHLDMVRFLVELGATVDVRGHFRVTPLMLASGGGHLDVVRFLMKRGVFVNSSDALGTTALICAARDGHLDVVRYLVEHGAAIDDSDNDGWTPLIRATKKGHLDVMRFLVEHGAIVDAHDKRGMTSLICAARDGYLDMVRFLVEHEAIVDAHDKRGMTSLICAAKTGHLDMVRFLVEHGAIVDAHDKRGMTSLICAAENGHLDMVRYLVEHGAIVDAHDKRGMTSLICAARDGHLDMVRFLINHGATVDVRSRFGVMPLMLASGGGHLDVVRYLLKLKRNSSLKSTACYDALSIAAKFGRQEVVKNLRQLVRHQDQMTQMEHHDEHLTQHSNIPSSWLIPPFEVEVEPFIDGRYFGGDYRGKWLDADVVVKLFIDDATSASFVDEVRLWHQLRHPNVLKLYGVCKTAHYLFVCEYASNGSLPEFLKSCDVDHRTPWKFLYEAALGLEYLHERKIVHGNLRGSNILIGSDGLAKLSGFGLSASSTEGERYASGDWVRWAAAECLKGEQVSSASDVYSLGMCILEAVSGHVPFYRQNEQEVIRLKKDDPYPHMNMGYLYSKITKAQWELVWEMCRHDEPRKRLQMPAVVNKLEQFAETEAAEVKEHTTQHEPEPQISFDTFELLDCGIFDSLWIEVETLVDQSKNPIYCQMWHDLELILDTLKEKCHPWSTLKQFHNLLKECKHGIDTISQQNRICRLSATRARDYSAQSLHRRICQLLHLVRPHGGNTETRETEWKRLCREQIEIFVSEASEACVLLSSVDSEEDRSALVAVLRAELRKSDGNYTDKQLAVLQKAHNDIESNPLKDVQRATTPEWFIPWFELEMNEITLLGEGGFGSVFEARWLDSEVVVKKLEIDSKDTDNVDKKREMRRMFEREVNIWFGLSHPHVVRLFGACHVGRPFFVCELAPNGTLDEYLRHHPDELWLKLREAALGVQYLHARGIVHGDLKGNNILIGSDGKAKVTDFGLSGVFDDDSKEVIFSNAWNWVAPECLLGEKPTFASDIYSLGMCIIEALRVASGVQFTCPWGNLDNTSIKHYATRNTLPLRPCNCSDEAWTVIECMCKSDPDDRMLIMTVVDELEKLADRRGDLGGETDQIVSDIGELRLSSSSVANALAEMKNWIGKCDTRSDWEGGVLKNIYQLLWDRLEQVATKLFPDAEDTIVTKTTTSDFCTLVELSKQRTRETLGITGIIPLIKFTELTLGGYALHRRLDKLTAAHAIPKDSSPLHNWTSACSTFVRVSANPIPACSKEDCSVDELTEGSTKMASSTEVAAEP